MRSTYFIRHVLVYNVASLHAGFFPEFFFTIRISMFTLWLLERAAGEQNLRLN